MGEEDHPELFVSTRGAFIKRMVAAGFGVPMIGTFGFTELAAAACRPQQSFGNQTPPGHGNNPPPPHDDQGPPQQGDQGPPQYGDQGPSQYGDQGSSQFGDRDPRGRGGH